MQNESCAECIAAMEQVRGELLARLACANCQHMPEAQEDVARRQQELAGCRLLGMRSYQCGNRKWLTPQLDLLWSCVARIRRMGWGITNKE